MNIETKIGEGKMEVVLAGNIYVAEAKELRECLAALIDSGQKYLLIDFTQVDYIDGSGMGMLVSIQKHAALRGGGITIKGVQGLVKQLFEMTRLVNVLEIRE